MPKSVEGKARIKKNTERVFKGKKKGKWFPGCEISTLQEAITTLMSGKPVFWRNKFMASGFIQHWSLRQIQKCVDTRGSHEARFSITSDVHPCNFINFYKCPDCGNVWQSIWDATCDDDCPSCGKRHLSPFKSQDADAGSQAPGDEGSSSVSKGKRTVAIQLFGGNVTGFFVSDKSLMNVEFVVTEDPKYINDDSGNWVRGGKFDGACVVAYSGNPALAEAETFIALKNATGPGITGESCNSDVLTADDRESDECWKIINDNAVRMTWKHRECRAADCENNNKSIFISPAFYQENGTPVCECCGDYFEYVCTEIKVDSREQTNLDKYLEIPCLCPFCGSDNLQYGSIDMECGSAAQKVFCVDCGKGWDDTYQLTGYMV